jgi:hypothetical protein
LGLAGISETGDYSGAAWGQRSLAIWNWYWHGRRAYHFTTYNWPHDSNRNEQLDYDYL